MNTHPQLRPVVQGCRLVIDSALVRELEALKATAVTHRIIALNYFIRLAH